MTRTVVTTDALMRPIAEFSLGLRVGDDVYVGATAGTDPGRVLAGYEPGRIDIRTQTTTMYRNMETALKLLGGSLDDVVSLKVWVDDVRDFTACEAVAVEVFGVPGPSRMAVGSWGFPLPQAVVEADLVAVVGGPSASARFCCTAVPRDISGGFAEQVRSSLRALAEALDGAGLSLGDAVMLTVTLADMRAAPEAENAFRSAFPARAPARSVVAAPLAASGQLVALECVAMRGGGTPIGASGEAMLAGDTLYIGGQLGSGTGIEAQTVAAWERIERLVREAGMGLEDVVSTRNVLAEWRDYRGFNAGFSRFVTPPYPPRATICAALGDPMARVQIEAVVHREGRNARVIEVTTP